MSDFSITISKNILEFRPDTSKSELLQFELSPPAATIGIGSCVAPQNKSVEDVRDTLKLMRSKVDAVFKEYETVLSDDNKLAELNKGQIDTIKDKFRDALNLQKGDPLKISYGKDLGDTEFTYITLGTTGSNVKRETYVVFAKNDVTGKFERSLLNPCLLGPKDDDEGPKARR